jgi:hypothetical protein
LLYRRILLFLALAPFAALDVPPARAGAWRSAPGWTYAELFVSTLSADRISGGIETLETTNTTLRLYAEVALAERWTAVLGLPLLERHAFGPARSTRLGDLTLGLRHALVQRERWALAPSLGVLIPTVAAERRLGEVHLGSGGVASFANDAAGVAEIVPGLVLSTRIGRAWADAGAGYVARFGYVDQVSAGAQLYVPLAGRIAATVGAHSRTNLASPAGTGALLANGVGESAEHVGWYLRTDYRLASGLGVGAGLDGALRLKSYPAAPAFSARISYSGRLWGRR